MTFQKTGLPIQPQNTFTVTMCGSVSSGLGDEVLTWSGVAADEFLVGGWRSPPADDNFALPLTSGNAEVVVGRQGDRHRRAPSQDDHRRVGHPHRLQVEHLVTGVENGREGQEERPLAAHPTVYYTMPHGVVNGRVVCSVVE